VATGNGLENMRQRMAEIGGSFAIQPGASGGTTILFSVECPQVSP
jgi:signal transduction histidine kinase